MKPLELVRFGEPSDLDVQPYGTRVIVSINDGLDYHLWIQVGPDEDSKWEYMGEFKKNDQDHKFHE